MATWPWSQAGYRPGRSGHARRGSDPIVRIAPAVEVVAADADSRRPWRADRPTLRDPGARCRTACDHADFLPARITADPAHRGRISCRTGGWFASPAGGRARAQSRL